MKLLSQDLHLCIFTLQHYILDFSEALVSGFTLVYIYTSALHTWTSVKLLSQDLHLCIFTLQHYVLDFGEALVSGFTLVYIYTLALRTWLRWSSCRSIYTCVYLHFSITYLTSVKLLSQYLHLCTLHLLDFSEALVAVFTLVTPTLIHRDRLMSLLVLDQIFLQQQQTN